VEKAEAIREGELPLLSPFTPISNVILSDSEGSPSLKTLLIKKQIM
jgi:hypothetical protein